MSLSEYVWMFIFYQSVEYKHIFLYFNTILNNVYT